MIPIPVFVRKNKLTFGMMKQCSTGILYIGEQCPGRRLKGNFQEFSKGIVTPYLVREVGL